MKFTNMAGKKHICIITQSHLCRNPRVVKEAQLLSAFYKITIINSTYSLALSTQDGALIDGHDIHIISVAQLENKNALTFLYRAIKKTGNLLVKYLSVQTHLALGYATFKYISTALKLKADLYICHQELGLYCGNQLLKRNKKVGFDFEDWYSEDLLPDARLQRPVKLLHQLEKYALQNAVFCLTTSNVMAAAMAKKNQTSLPLTIYNSFPAVNAHQMAPKQLSGPLKLIWFSQTIGPGRGIEEFIKLVDGITPSIDITLLGQVTTSYAQSLAKLKGTNNLLFHPLVPAGQLTNKIAEFDIGLALEMEHSLNQKYTISNKLFQYLASGLPVIATNTLGQQEIMARYNIGVTINFINPQQSLLQINNLFNTVNSQNIKQNATGAASQLSWDNEKIKLLNVVKKHLDE